MYYLLSNQQWSWYNFTRIMSSIPKRIPFSMTTQVLVRCSICYRTSKSPCGEYYLCNHIRLAHMDSAMFSGEHDDGVVYDPERAGSGFQLASPVRIFSKQQAHRAEQRHWKNALVVKFSILDDISAEDVIRLLCLAEHAGDKLNCHFFFGFPSETCKLLVEKILPCNCQNPPRDSWMFTKSDWFFAL